MRLPLRCLEALSLVALLAGCGRTQFEEPIDGLGGTAGLGGSGGFVGTGGAGGRGAGGAGGIGGAGGGPPLCVPGTSQKCACSNGDTGAQTCGATGTFGACVCTTSAFDVLRAGMVGTWIGTNTNPWTSPYKVTITFGADGHYSGHCAQGMCPSSVFYYGTDDDSPAKTYALRTLNADGTGAGVIGILFPPNDVPGTPGTLDEVALSADGQHLTFEFWPTWLGRIGPVKFDLTRVP